MEKQTKNVITRDFIEKELRFYNTADIRSTLVLCGGLSLFFVPLTIGAVYGFFALLENVCLKILLSVLVGGLIYYRREISIFYIVYRFLDRPGTT